MASQNVPSNFKDLIQNLVNLKPILAVVTITLRLIAEVKTERTFVSYFGNVTTSLFPQSRKGNFLFGDPKQY